MRRPIERARRRQFAVLLEHRASALAAASRHPRRAAVSAFGFGGSNFHCVLEEAEPAEAGSRLGRRRADPRSLGRSSRISCSSSSGRSNAWPIGPRFGRGSREPAGVRPRPKLRPLLIVARRDQTDWPALLATARARVDAFASDPEGSVPRRTDSSAAARGERVAVFCGTGASLGTARICCFPARDHSTPACSASWLAGSRECSSRSLWQTRCCNPGKCRSRAGSIRDRSLAITSSATGAGALRDTRIAQPAIGAVSLGLLAILEDFGLRPEIVGGHSFGELVALASRGADSMTRRSRCWPRSAAS